jgi:hypothetical protein
VWWLKPVILDTWEAEIRRIMFPKPAQAKSSQDPILTKLGIVADAVIPAMQKA